MDLKKLVENLAATKSARDEALLKWDETKESGGAPARDAKEAFDRARVNYERAAGDFIEGTNWLRSQGLLSLSRDFLDAESVPVFLHAIGEYRLDALLEPRRFAEFGDAVCAWRQESRNRDAARKQYDIIRTSDDLPEVKVRLAAWLNDEFDDGIDDDELTSRGHVHEVYEFALGQLTQRAAGESPLALAERAADKVYRLATHELENVEDYMTAALHAMSYGEYQHVLDTLPDEIAMLLRRAINNGAFPSPELKDPRLQPQRQEQPRTRVEVATKLREEEETSDDVGLDPEAEAQVDELLKSIFGGTN